MKKIKGMFEKHDLMKIVLLAVLVTIVFTWVIPYGNVSNGTYTSYGLNRQGLSDILLSGVYSANFFIQQIIFVIFVGVFYGIITHISGYNALVNKIANKLKGKEKIFVISTSLIITLLTSFLTQTYVILVFVPFIINVVTKMKLDKLTAFLCTFGSILIGILGATYGTEGLVYFFYYLNYHQTVSLTADVAIRFGVLALALCLYNFFTIRHMNVVLASKKNEEKVEDLFEVNDDKNKKVKIWPMASFLIAITIFTVLGYVNWSGNFNITIFDEFHTWLTELSIGKYSVIAYILGNNATAFGAWDLYIITIVMTIVLVLSAVIYRVKSDELIENAIEGIKKMVKPLLLLSLIYVCFVFVNWCPFTVTICNWVTSLADGFNPFLATISAMISSLFHIDFGYAAYILGDIITTTYASSSEIGILIYIVINGLVGFVAPTSAILLIGLSYLNIPYKNWMKHIWKFVLIMLALLLIIFALLTYI